LGSSSLRTRLSLVFGKWQSPSTRGKYFESPSNVMWFSTTIRPLKVVFYEPFGRGGICHYTFQLANALAQMGTKVTVITNGPYELDSLPRCFTLNTQLTQTYTKRFLTRLITPLRSALSTKKISSPNIAALPHSDKKILKRARANSLSCSYSPSHCPPTMAIQSERGSFLHTYFETTRI
jgi:hypothetical protein